MKKIVTLLVCVALALLMSCSKDDSPTMDSSFVNDDDIGDSMNEEDNAFFESISVPNPTLQEMTGADGNPLGKNFNTSILNNLINTMLLDAQGICAQKLFIKYPEEGEFGPEHFGIAYSYGQRNFLKRLPPPGKGANPIHKQYSVYGTDCSGFVLNLIKAGGVNVANFEVGTFVEEFSKALKNDKVYNKLKLENLHSLPIAQIKNGDFIIWNGIEPILNIPKKHMGIASVLTGNLGKIMFQSNGIKNPENEEKQALNLGLGRGAHPINLVEAFKAVNKAGKENYWGLNYEVYRLTEITTDPTPTPSPTPSPAPTPFDNSLIIGRWKLTSYIINGRESIGFLDACEVDDIWVIMNNNIVIQDEGATKCDPDDPQIVGTGTYSINGTQFTGIGPEATLTYTIIVLNSTTLQLSGYNEKVTFIRL